MQSTPSNLLETLLQGLASKTSVWDGTTMRVIYSRIYAGARDNAGNATLGVRPESSYLLDVLRLHIKRTAVQTTLLHSENQVHSISKYFSKNKPDPQHYQTTLWKSIYHQKHGKHRPQGTFQLQGRACREPQTAKGQSDWSRYFWSVYGN